MPIADARPTTQAALAGLYVPLILVEESGALAAVGEAQRDAIVYLATRLFLGA